MRNKIFLLKSDSYYSDIRKESRTSDFVTFIDKLDNLQILPRIGTIYKNKNILKNI